MDDSGPGGGAESDGLRRPGGSAGDGGGCAPGGRGGGDEGRPGGDRDGERGGGPAVDLLLLPEASGTQVRKNDQAEIDYSHPEDGYVMVRYPAQSEKRIKVQVKGPSTTYTYNLTPGSEDWTTFPLSDGNGWYQVVVYRNISGTKYSQQLSAGFQVTLADEFAPYLRPNQYVDYSGAEKTVAKAAELVKGKKTALQQVDAIYQFVVKNLSYDYIKAQNVKSGYLPVLDTVLEKKKGICFDYACPHDRDAPVPRASLQAGGGLLPAVPTTPGSASGRRRPAGWRAPSTSTARAGSGWTPPSPPPAGSRRPS